MLPEIFSASEINQIEQTYQLGVPCLGQAFRHWLYRWEMRVRDQETALRLVFLGWYRDCGKWEMVSGDLDVRTPEIEAFIEEYGGLAAMDAESLFVIGFLADMSPWAMGDETKWEAQAGKVLARAAEKEPGSALFADWPFFVYEADEIRAARQALQQEIHARFHGRGEMGRFMEKALTARLTELSRQPTRRE